MNTKKKVKEIVTPVVTTVKVSYIVKLEPFGNEEMHRLVAKINEIIDAL